MLQIIRKYLLNLACTFFKGKKCIGIDLYIKKDGSFELNMVKVRKDKIISKESKNISIDKINQYLGDRRIATYISIRGANLINKKIHLKTSDTKKALKNVLPGIKPDNYYIQSFTDETGNKFLSVIPISIHKELIRQLPENTVEVILGPYSLISTKVHSNAFHLTHEKVTKTKEDIIITEQEEETGNNTIEGRKLKANETLAFANTRLHFRENKIISPAFKDFLYKKATSFFLLYGLGFIFLLLLTNTLYSGSLKQEYNKMQNKSLSLQNQINVLDTQHSGLTKKYRFVKQNNLLSKSRTSWIADIIGSCVPVEISLTEVDINPKQKFSDDIPTFKNEIIKIEGISNNNENINIFINKIRNINFIDEVTILNLSKTEGKYKFSLRIRYHV